LRFRRSGRRHSTGRAARAGLVLCLLLLAAARLGGSYSAFDVINLAAAPLALASVLLAVFLSFRARSWAGRALLGLCVLPGLVTLLPERTETVACGPSAQRLRVAWINAHHPERPDRIAAWLEAEQPQVVGVAELRTGLALRDVLQERYPHWHSCLDNGRCSTLLYSRAAPVEARGLAHGDPENRKALSAVRITFRRGEAHGNQSPAVTQILAVHLSRPLPFGGQRRELLELDKYLGLPADTVIMGDFNMSPRMRLLRDFAARNGLAVTPTGRPTWPITIRGHSLPGLWQIDHLLVGRDWQVAAIRTGPDVGSDHKGFVADLCRRAR
jgi:endonuclease/exonuclease/phosphatase (EEP) superfamily protein YafD